MELYNPPNIDLPALKIKKTVERQNIEDDPTVTNLIRSKLLLDVGFNKLYLDILEKSKTLLKIISMKEDEILYEYFIVPSVFEPYRNFKDWRYTILSDEYDILHDNGEIPPAVKKRHKKTKATIKKEIFNDVNRIISNLSNGIQNSISDFEKRRKIDLSILSSITIHACKKCSNIIAVDKFKHCNCSCGERITKTSQITQVPIHHFNSRLINFLDRNYWLEHGVDYILRRKNLNTLVGYHVLGHSGVWHEIDNIADSKNENYRVFCECKNAEVTVNDIFIFSGKMIDIGCTRGYVFTTSEKASKEIVRLARSKNIDIIKEVLTRETKTLLRDLKEGWDQGDS